MSSQTIARLAPLIALAARPRSGWQRRYCAAVGWMLVLLSIGTGCAPMSQAWRGARGDWQRTDSAHSSAQASAQARTDREQVSRSGGWSSGPQADGQRGSNRDGRGEFAASGQGPQARLMDRQVTRESERRSLSDRDHNNPLRSQRAAAESDTSDIAAANYEAQSEDDPWGPQSQALSGSQTQTPPYDLETTSLQQDGNPDLASNPDDDAPINDWMERPEPLPLPNNDINTSDRRQATENLADSAAGHFKNGPGYQPQHLQQQSLSATEYALQLQREKKKLLEQIQQQINQELYLTKRLETESAAHATTRDELEKSRQLVARLSYEIKQLQADNASWQQKHAQLEQRYRDYTRGVEQTLDEMLLQALAQQAKGGK